MSLDTIVVAVISLLGTLADSLSVKETLKFLSLSCGAAS